MPAIASKRTHPRRYVPDNLDPLDLGAVTRLYDRLEELDVSTREGLESFILDWEELSAVLTECYVDAYVNMTADTTNPEYEERYGRVVEELMPVFEQQGFRLKRKLLQSPAVDRLGGEYEVYLRDIRAEVELYREENIPLLTEERKMDQEFEKISGAQKAEVRGRVYTLPQLARFLEETDRELREEAWTARARAKLADADALDALFDRLYEVREEIAHNAGFDNYRDYRFKAMKRFDYSPEDCLAFHEAVEKHVVPVVLEDQERRRRLLGLDTLRPWDLAMDPEGREPLRPFSTVEQLQEGCARIFSRVDPELGAFFKTMIRENLLDLENRPGKSPGGYMESFTDRRVPFIFMNAVGTKRDVDTLLHEGGHSFHYFLAREQPLNSYHFAGLEFSEVASMSMELLSRPYLGEFYSGEELGRLKEDQLREVLKFFPFMAMIDAFQHWVYTTPDHGADERREVWTGLEKRFRPGIDWSGWEDHRATGWQYPHVFSVPFYYVEYGIAQLAALRVWLNSLRDERGAVKRYKHALAMGGSRPLPELFEAAGVEFSLDERAVSEVVRGTLGQMPARA